MIIIITIIIIIIIIIITIIRARGRVWQVVDGASAAVVWHRCCTGTLRLDAEQMATGARHDYPARTQTLQPLAIRWNKELATLR